MMLSRFAQAFLLAALIILIPTALFLSHGSESVVYDRWSGHFLSAAGVGANDGSAVGAAGDGWAKWNPSNWRMGKARPAGGDPAWMGLGGEMHGGVIASKLGNATAKAELGRATWKLLHTMTLRFPEHPTKDERDALKSYFYLFSRLYPCGECAKHFQELLKEYPPQTSSRKAASFWLCHAHNLVNARLGKPEFDCQKLDSTYDCGCGPESESASATGKAKETARAEEKTATAVMEEGDGTRRDPVTGEKIVHGR